MRRYLCPFSRCDRYCLTAWGIKRHVKGHMDRIHARLDAGDHFGRSGGPE